MTNGDGYKQLAELLGYPDSERFHKLLKYMMTEEQARIVVTLPGEAEELSQKLNMDVETIKNLEYDLYKKGVIVPKNFETLEGMRFIQSVVFFHDRTLAIKDWPSNLPKLDQLWDDFLEAEFFKDHAKNYEKREQPALRLLPYYKAVMDSPEFLPEEDVREILKQASTIGVVPCSCRVRTGKCKKIQTDVCMQFNRSAEYGISVGMGGAGKPLSYEEALAVIDAAEEGGLIHQWGNAAKMSGASLCNCCSCCCIDGLPLIEEHVSPIKRWAKSRYEAKIDPAVCIGCKDEPSPPCISICPEYFDAIRKEWLPGVSEFKAVADPEKCWGCGACVLKCPVGAIKMELVRPADHIPGIGAPKA